jgi:chromosome segregation ATPase
MDYVGWWNIIWPFALGFCSVYFFKRYRHERRRVAAYKEKVKEYVQTSIELARDLEVCRTRNSSLMHQLKAAKDEGGIFTREANRMGQDVFQMNQQIAYLKTENKKLIRDIRALEKRIPTGETGI